MEKELEIIRRLYNVLPNIFPPGEKMARLWVDERAVRFEIGGAIYRCDKATMDTEVSENGLLIRNTWSMIITSQLKNGAN